MTANDWILPWFMLVRIMYIMLNVKPLSLSSQLTVLLPEQHLMHKSAGKY